MSNVLGIDFGMHSVRMVYRSSEDKYIQIINQKDANFPFLVVKKDENSYLTGSDAVDYVKAYPDKKHIYISHILEGFAAAAPLADDIEFILYKYMKMLLTKAQFQLRFNIDEVVLSVWTNDYRILAALSKAAASVGVAVKRVVPTTEIWMHLLIENNRISDGEKCIICTMNEGVACIAAVEYEQNVMEVLGEQHIHYQWWEKDQTDAIGLAMKQIVREFQWRYDDIDKIFMAFTHVLEKEDYACYGSYFGDKLTVFIAMETVNDQMAADLGNHLSGRSCLKNILVLNCTNYFAGLKKKDGSVLKLLDYGASIPIMHNVLLPIGHPSNGQIPCLIDFVSDKGEISVVYGTAFDKEQYEKLMDVKVDYHLLSGIGDLEVSIQMDVCRNIMMKLSNIEKGQTQDVELLKISYTKCEASVLSEAAEKEHRLRSMAKVVQKKRKNYILGIDLCKTGAHMMYRKENGEYVPIKNDDGYTYFPGAVAKNEKGEYLFGIDARRYNQEHGIEDEFNVYMLLMSNVPDSEYSKDEALILKLYIKMLIKAAQEAQGIHVDAIALSLWTNDAIVEKKILNAVADNGVGVKCIKKSVELWIHYLISLKKIVNGQRVVICTVTENIANALLVEYSDNKLYVRARREESYLRAQGRAAETIRDIYSTLANEGKIPEATIDHFYIACLFEEGNDIIELKKQFGDRVSIYNNMQNINVNVITMMANKLAADAKQKNRHRAQPPKDNG